MTVVTAVVGNIKTGPLKDYRHRGKDTLGITTTAGTGDRSIVTKTFFQLKPTGAAVTLVFVDGQF